MKLRKYSLEELEHAIQSSVSVRKVLRKLGVWRHFLARTADSSGA